MNSNRVFDMGTISYGIEELGQDLKQKLFVTKDVHMGFERHLGCWGLARLYFVDHAGLPVAIPRGLRVLQDGDGKGGGMPITPQGQLFVLSCDGQYDIFVDDDLFYRLRKQAQHAVRGPGSCAAVTVNLGGRAAQTAWATEELYRAVASIGNDGGI